MARKKLTRRELVQKDEITSTLEQVTTFAVENRKPLLTIGAVIVVAATVLVGWNIFAANREANAQSALSEVIRLYTDTTLAEGKERFQATLTEAQRVQAEYPNQTAAQIAQYYAALSHKGLGNSSEAVRLLRELIDSGDETIRQVARYALAESYKSNEEFENAITVYRELVDSDGYSKGAVLYELGRLHETISKPDEARDYYQSLVGEYPDSPFRVDADRALKRLAETGEDSEEAS